MNPMKPMKERSIAIFCFRGGFKTKMPFYSQGDLSLKSVHEIAALSSFVTFLFGQATKKSKEGEERTNNHKP
jgi:hypothetical protein